MSQGNVVRLDRTVAESDDVSTASPHGLGNQDHEITHDSSRTINDASVIETSEPINEPKDEINTSVAVAENTEIIDTVHGENYNHNDDSDGYESELPKKSRLTKGVMIGGAIGAFSVLTLAIMYAMYPGNDQEAWYAIDGKIVEFKKSIFVDEKLNTFDKSATIPSTTTTVAEDEKIGSPISSAAPVIATKNISPDITPILVSEVESALGEVAISGAVKSDEQIAVVLNAINNERVAMNQEPLSPTEIVDAISVASTKLGIAESDSKAIVDKSITISKAQQVASLLLVNMADANDETKALAIAEEIQKAVPAISPYELQMAIKSTANKAGLTSSATDQVIAGSIAENTALSDAATKAVVDKNIDPEVALYEISKNAITANANAQTDYRNNLFKNTDGIAPVALPLEKQLGVTEKAAKKMKASPLAQKMVVAQITAENKARSEGLSPESQIAAGKIAAAEVKAESLDLNAYEAALYVAQKVPHSQAIDTVAVNRRMNPIAKSIVSAHAAAREAQHEQFKATGEKPDASKSIAEVANAVTLAAVDAKLSPTDSKIFVKEAVEFEAKSFNVSAEERQAALTRAMTMIDAKEAGLSDLASVAVSAGAASVATSNGEQTQEQKANALATAIGVVKAAGITPDSEKEVIASVEKFMGASAKPQVSTSSVPTAPNSTNITETAYAEADKLKLNTIEREAYVAKARATYKAKEAGLTDQQTAVAVARAQARARAQSLGISEARIADIELRAGNAEIAKQGLSEQQIQVTNHAITKLESGNFLQTNNQKLDLQTVKAEAGVVNAQNNELRDQINRMELRISALAQKVNESIDLSSKVASNNASLNNTIVQLQAAVNSNAVEIKNQRAAAQAEVDRRTANAGWLSSRLCEMEAASGTFSNPTVCKVEYARFRGQPVEQFGQQQNAQPQYSPQNQGSYSIKPTNLNDVASASPYSGIPSTDNHVPGYGEQGERIYANIPDSQLPMNAQQAFVSHDACTAKNPNYSYVIISEDNALITNRMGAQQRVVKGSYVPDLGSVITFQVRQEPRFISFENGIICQQDFKSN